MASLPTLVSTPRFEMVTISTANTNRDGTGTIASLITGADAGTLLHRIQVKASVTTTAGMIRVFMSTNGGTTWVLWREINVFAVTPSATASSFEGEMDLNFMPLALRDSSHAIGVSTEKAESFNVMAIGGDLT